MTETSCELCSLESPLTPFKVSGPAPAGIGNTALLCDKCQTQLMDGQNLDVNHWRCLQESIWTDSEAVKVLAWRVLNKLSAEGWAQELLQQIDLEEALLAWASEATSKSERASPEPRDSNGTVLKNGDSVTLIKDLDVKGAGFTAKRGTLVKNISLTEDPALIEGKVSGTQIVLKTCFLKKAT